MKPRQWWFEEGRKRERIAVVRLIKKIAKVEAESVSRSGYASLLGTVADLIQNRK